MPPLEAFDMQPRALSATRRHRPKLLRFLIYVREII